jgi:hypothetical protein
MLTAAVALSAPVFADNDPSLQDIYDQAKSGHLDQAQQMINQVLRDHPNSGKAHYVAAELDAKQGNLSLGRVEFNKAQQLDPGLTFARPEAVRSLQAELGFASGLSSGTRQLVEPVLPVRHSFPWGALLIAVIAIGVIWAVFRRRSPYVGGGGGYPARVAPMGGAPGYGPAGGYGGGPGYGPGPGYGAPGGGIGSGIVGGLASGLAVGAGVVAGEEVAHHFLDGGERREEFAAAPQETPISNPGNGEMGGSDFGVNDPGSWDDSGGGGGGGGDWGDSGGGGGGGSDWT